MRSRLELGVIGVRCGEHSTGRGERRLPDAAGIARAVEPLMVLDRGRAVLGEAGGRGKHALGQVGVQPDPLELRRRQLGGLVPHRVGDAEPPEVVQQPGAADMGGCGAAQTHRGGGARRQFGDSAGVAEGERGLDVDEVGDRLQRSVERVRRQRRGQAGLGVDHSPPAGGQVQILEQRRRLSRDEIDQRGVELGAAAFAGDADRPVIARGAVIDLDDVGQRDDPSRQQQVVALGAVRDPLAVPALEGLADRVADVLAQTQAAARACRRRTSGWRACRRRHGDRPPRSAPPSAPARAAGDPRRGGWPCTSAVRSRWRR